MNAAGAPCYHMNTGKFKRGLSFTLHQELHWLKVSERIQFRVTATVYRCLHNMEPRYLTEMCMPTGMSARRQRLRSATTSDLVINSTSPTIDVLLSCLQRRRPSLPERLTRLPQVTGSVI